MVLTESSSSEKLDLKTEDALNRENRKKIIDELKKQQPNKHLFAKILKFIFYFGIVIILILTVRSFLKSVDIIKPAIPDANIEERESINKVNVQDKDENKIN